MVKRFFEVFIDEFSIFSDIFSKCLYHLKLVIVRCKEKNLIINWKKYHFIIKHGIILEYIILNKEIELIKKKSIW